MRVVGVLARHAMIFDLYGGASDAAGYYDTGRIIAEQLRGLDFGIIGSGQFGDREWGTSALRYISGFVMVFTGPSVRAAFLVFSLAAFAGLVCVVVAFGRANSAASMRQAAWLLFFWPTLWFWPSSMGKEAVLLLAVGLVTLGYVGRSERIHWLPLGAGLALALAIRPHLAAVLVVAACLAEWTSPGWTLRRVAQSIVTGALALYLVVSALNLLGLANADLGAVEGFILQKAQQTNQGGSAFERSGSITTAVPMAFVNILYRPFLTEVNNTMALASALEMMGFWVLVIRNRRRLPAIVRSWRTDRFLRFAGPFAVLYVLMIGLTFQNFGIIARQRALVMPALLLVLAAAPPVRQRIVGAVQVRRRWRAARTPLPASGS
jgi:hypothetical protein